jgi:transposase, IS5 family
LVNFHVIIPILDAMKKEEKLGMTDYLVQTRRKVKKQFFEQVNAIVDWRPISNIINKHYSKGEDVCGRPAYSGLILFKMGLLQTWYGLSDYEVEDRVNDSISFSKFAGLSLDESVPDHSVLSRFRKELTDKKVYEKLFKELNKQLEKHKIIVKTGVIVDASIIDTPLMPKGKPTYEICDERDATEENQSTATAVKQVSSGTDTDGRWISKGGELRYGYKKHVLTDTEGMILGVHTTAANVNEIANLAEVLACADLPENIALYADKGYQSEKNRILLKERKLKNRILKKAKKNKPLTVLELRFNKLVGKTRFKVERCFGSIKRWFNGALARYKGLAKMHTQNLMESMSYNLYRSPGIIMSNCQIQRK